MRWMFAGSSFDQQLCWDISKVTNTKDMFDGSDGGCIKNSCCVNCHSDLLCDSPQLLDDTNCQNINSKCCLNIVEVGDNCIPGKPHFDPEGAVCDNDGKSNEAYCSYDVGPNACAYCEDSQQTS